MTCRTCPRAITIFEKRRYGGLCAICFDKALRLAAREVGKRNGRHTR